MENNSNRRPGRRRPRFGSQSRPSSDSRPTGSGGFGRPPGGGGPRGFSGGRGRGRGIPRNARNTFVPRDTRRSTSTPNGASRPQRDVNNQNSTKAETDRSPEDAFFERGTSNGDDRPVPKLEPGNIRVIPLGGVEEIGRNMVAIEYGGDIIVIDCGFQFREEETPGIDYILPNTKYLEDNMDRVRGIFITHGHLDHIGAIPYVIDKIGYPPIYTRRLTAVMIKKRQEEFPHLKPLDIYEVEKNEAVKVGNLKVRFFSVYHTIPDSMGIIVETPYGWIVHTGDLRLDHIDGIPAESEEKEYALFSSNEGSFSDQNGHKKVLMLMQDSTNVEKPGFSISETTVLKNLDDIIAKASGRLIISTFASQLERIIHMIEFAASQGKKLLIEGRGMKVNIEIAKQLGLLKVPEKVFIGPEELDSVPDNKLVIFATGAQGDEFAALMRIAVKTHKNVRIKKGDVVVLSSSVVPGNERSVQKLKDNLSRQGAKIIHRDTMDVHASGHASRDETVWIHMRINPRFFMPIHGYHYMLRTHGEIAKACGRADDEIAIPDNGAIFEIQGEGTKLVRRKENAPNSLRLVDGFSIGDIQEVVIRDRKMLAQDGMFVIIATVNPKNGKLRKSPDIISRGFIYLRESQELLQQTRIIIKKTIEDTTHNMQPVNFDYVKANVTDAVARFLFEKTNKRPIVIPVVLGV